MRKTDLRDIDLTLIAIESGEATHKEINALLGDLNLRIETICDIIDLLQTRAKEMCLHRDHLIVRQKTYEEKK